MPCDEAQGMLSTFESALVSYLTALATAEKSSTIFEEYESEDRGRLDITLGLLLGPHRPTDPGTLTKFVFWDGERDGEDEDHGDGDEKTNACATSDCDGDLENLKDSDVADDF
ncbi:hypothetical protein HO133_003151 [Letharia lupina]|uniref:Uncharacterized protein n=1 Tax=Letharia lupina TaxID=560253 RepID=A0A8H6CCC1_9LECA|nr:uncharacterized protein HO133_003151 [Letharia lupina]KAF6220718.1 hypothetical protein HO133_003151 [Letharia lupina]